MNLGTILGLAMFAAIPAPEPSPFCRDSGPPGARLLVVISDLHFGVGHDDVSGAVHPFEDFRWADDFTAFLADIDRRGRGKTTLVLNGDAFELWQSFAHDCRPPQKDWSCSESEALERLERVVTQHSREMTLLRTFAASSDNRLVLVPGNHDAALLFEKVAARALTAISAPEGRVCIARKGYWASPDGLVFAEHGHQIGDDVNAFSGWPEPFGGPAGERRLQKTWGEAFVEDYYNPYELKYPIIDNIAEVGVGLVYGLSAEGHLGSALALGKLVSFFVMKTSKEQFDQSLSPHAEARWDVTEARKQTDRLLIEAVPRASPLRGALEDLAARGELSAVELD
ncbi:MAG TPA: metallophosphoesterase, partial [Vicinamibacteria bacterium]